MVATPEITLVVVPGERFSAVPRALEAIFHRTRMPFQMIFVDAASPPDTKRWLRRQSQLHGFRLIRTWGYVSPNRARNLAVRHVRTPYVALLDYDTLVARGWLQALKSCADETSAAVVSPIYCRNEPEADVIHMAGGAARVVRDGDQRSLVHEPYLSGKVMDDVNDLVGREATELASLRCILARRSVLEQIGPFDEGLKSGGESLDFCLQLREQRQEIMLEPAAVATYVPPPPLEVDDLPFYRRRWSAAWNQASLARLRNKWRLDWRDPALVDLAYRLDRRRFAAPEGGSRWRRLLECRPSRLLQWVFS